MTKRAKRATRPNPRVNRALPDQENIIELDHFKRLRSKRIEIIPHNLIQETYIDALFNENQYLVFAVGPAGTGKTYLATLFAIKALRDGLFDKIVITRPAVSVDEQHGFLPGNLVDKMEPWMLPILDVFKEHYTPKEITKMIENNLIEISPLAFMRGRTQKNAIVIGDEMQNATPSQMKMMLTRIGENSRMIITGDLTQHDRGYEQNGLLDFLQRCATHQNISIIHFGISEVERHPIIGDILKLYNE